MKIIQTDEGFSREVGDFIVWLDEINLRKYELSAVFMIINDKRRLLGKNILEGQYGVPMYTDQPFRKNTVYTIGFNAYLFRPSTGEIFMCKDNKPGFISAVKKMAAIV